MRILVAEDNLAIGNVIGFNLKQVGFEVVQVVSGETAWTCLQQQDYDLLITDFQMPGMNGGDLCRRMREEPSLAAVPVILLTAKGMEIDTEYYRETLGVSGTEEALQPSRIGSVGSADPRRPSRRSGSRLGGVLRCWQGTLARI